MNRVKTLIFSHVSPIRTAFVLCVGICQCFQVEIMESGNVEFGKITCTPTSDSLERDGKGCYLQLWWFLGVYGNHSCVKIATTSDGNMDPDPQESYFIGCTTTKNPIISSRGTWSSILKNHVIILPHLPKNICWGPFLSASEPISVQGILNYEGSEGSTEPYQMQFQWPRLSGPTSRRMMSWPARGG